MKSQLLQRDSGNRRRSLSANRAAPERRAAVAGRQCLSHRELQSPTIFKLMIKLLSVGLNSGEGFKNFSELSGGTQKQSGGATAGTAPITLLNQMPTGSSRRGPVLGKAAKEGGCTREG